MAFRLNRLQITGPNKPTAIVEFSRPVTLVFGPSESGKSYIYHCIAYCLGGDVAPDEIPEARGYDSIYLEVRAVRGSEPILDESERQATLDLEDSASPVDAEVFTIVRALAGGQEAIYRGSIESVGSAPKLKLDCNELVKRLVGVSNSQVFKKAGVKATITSSPLRHWSLLAQTAIGAKENVLGDTSARTERAAVLALIMSGVDDTAIATGLSTDERRAAGGGAEATRRMIENLKADLPEGIPQKEIEEALARVDATLEALTNQQKSRSQDLEDVRVQLSELAKALRKCETDIAQSAGLVSRFKLLGSKLQSDMDRLVALDESDAVYTLLDDVPCPLCGTTLPSATKASLVSEDSLRQQRKAISAEAEKTYRQRVGLAASLEFEESRLARLLAQQKDLSSRLEDYSRRERQMIEAGVGEFGHSATELADHKTLLFTQLRAFKEITRLTTEAARLDIISSGKNARIDRHLTQDGNDVSARALKLIGEWGLDINNVTFDATAFDIRIDGRKRTSFGHGVRALFLTAYYVALLEHAEGESRPHPGFAVIDSPLKNYADKKPEDSAVPLATVRSRFYKWLSGWSGPGQLIVLENEQPPEELHDVLQPLEFTKIEGVKRRGLFP
ncbi:AAA family ATPase [Paraburkholderia terrae]|uniref:AAA family ATPase n=1 Tax=Paraburkholderia terrae TaxID=311230 RepID=UPI00296AA9E4|nr:AAA family ATPase [Paraburkholderia terrae]MDW3661311.1 AAA family ATPase [Paraburkholderia terrae]